MAVIRIGPELTGAIELAHRADVPVMLVGGTGIGKSASVEAAADNLGIGFIARDLSLLEPVDLVGLPVIEDGQTSYAPPSFLPTEGRGLICLEELNRCPKHMRAPCLQLLTARTLNDYVLPPGWLPVASINPAEGDYQVDDLDKAVLARFSVLNVVPDKKAWLDWAERNDVHEAVRNYVRATPKIFDGDRSDPRAWTYVSRAVIAAERGSTSRATLMAFAAGLVGEKLAGAFLRTYEEPGSHEIPTAQMVISAYSKVRPKVKAWASEGNASALASLTHQVMVHLQDPSNEAAARSKRKAKAGLRALAVDLPAEFRRQLRSVFPWIGTTRRKRA